MNLKKGNMRTVFFEKEVKFVKYQKWAIKFFCEEL